MDTTYKSQYNEWFNETYGVDLTSDAGSVAGCPSLSNTATIGFSQHIAELDEKFVNKTKDYPAEELDFELRRVAQAKCIGKE